LSRATADVLLILDAAGFDVVLIETVGVGQDEVEIARTAEVTLVLLVPGMGDDVQTMKAGIMEIGDVLVINKADHPGVERVEAELRSLLAISSRPDGWRPAIVKTVSPEGKGIEECAQAIDAWRDAHRDSRFQKERSLQIHKERLLERISSEIQRSLMSAPGATARLESYARRVAERSIDPYSAAEELVAAWVKSGR